MAQDASFPAVTIAVAKKKGSNAVWVAREVERSLESLRGSDHPGRGAGPRSPATTARPPTRRSTTWSRASSMAIITVIVLIALAMSWRVRRHRRRWPCPITYSLTLLVNYLARLHDQPRDAVRADPGARACWWTTRSSAWRTSTGTWRCSSYPRLQAIALAMNEVLPPDRAGHAGHRRRVHPDVLHHRHDGPLHAPHGPQRAAGDAQLHARRLRHHALGLQQAAARTIAHEARAVRRQDRRGTYRVYSARHAALRRLAPQRRGCCWSSSAALFAFSLLLAATGRVPLKMLPFDNKNEFQMVVDMPESATLETTDAVVRELESYLRTRARGRRTSRPPWAPARPWTSTGWCATTTCGRARMWPTSGSTSCPAQQREMDSHAIVLRIRNDIAAIGRAERRAVEDRRGAAGPAGALHRRRRDLRPAAPRLRAT